MEEMNESVAIVKKADAKQGFSHTTSDKNVHRAQHEHGRQLGSLRDVKYVIKHDGDTPSVESIATNLSSMHTGERAPVLLAVQKTHGNWCNGWLPGFRLS